MLALPPALSALADYRQFILYFLQASTSRPGKTDKFPVDYRTLAVTDAHNREVWTDASTACARAAQLGDRYGVGFVFTEQDPFFFIDIDNCATPSGWSPVAQQIVGAFNGAAVEVSASGRGLHIFGRGTAPEHSSRSDAYGLEFYTSGRFVALTGTNAIGDARTDHTGALAWLTASYFPPRVTIHDDGWTAEPSAGWSGPVDDDELIRRACNSSSARSVFGGAASFADLWDCNVTALSHHFPDPVRAYDASRADAALAQHLAFWTGRNCERMKRLMERSGLVRDKYQRDDYLPRTVITAASQQREVMTEKQPAQLDPADSPPAAYDAPEQTEKTGSTFLGIAEQKTLFKGCVYIEDAHRVLVPGGQMLKADQFRVRYSGYSMPMDTANERVTRDAWEAFTQSQALNAPRAHSYCFRPDLKPGAVVSVDGLKLANTYVEIKTPRAAGDVTPFTRHLEKLIPDERDRQICLSYMAAIVQHKGIKFQWTIFLQGAEGNGKSLLSRCVAQAVSMAYTHYPKAKDIANNFNAWAYGKIFIAVEDIHIAEGKEDVLEALKPMITGEYLEIEPKGYDQVTRAVCANFIINSNHKGGIRKSRDGRRYAMFYTAQQRAEDCVRDGMGGDYFPDLYSWLRGDGKYQGQPSGYSIVNELLSTYPIPPEFNPAGLCQRAPDTSTNEEAIEQGLGRVEQEVLEAIDQGRPGFAGGWISSLMFDHLLDHINAAHRIPHNRRRELLKTLGYDWHPGLPQGRVNNAVMPDGGKPRLFVKAGTPQAMLTGAAEIGKAYTAAQKAAGTVVTI
jgi:hypothetical protein